ncbi:MAG: hypothetical protein HYX40_10330 [Sphingobacteriales bacterium]|nr:hypothetical protein [Sphingobacteriales bacterium]
MRLLFIISILCFQISSCSKSDSSAILYGKWINIKNTEDTLEFFKEGSKQIMFDNSLYLRASMSPYINIGNFKKEYTAPIGGKIGVRLYNSNSEFYSYNFTWLEFGNMFSIPVQAIRPQVSALYDITYIKVR